MLLSALFPKLLTEAANTFQHYARTGFNVAVTTEANKMKASNKTAPVVAAKAKAKEIVTVKVPVEITSAITTLATSEVAVFDASTAREQTIVGLGDKVKTHLGINSYEVTRASLKPVFETSYSAANKKAKSPKSDEALGLYIGQQLSRVMLLAYPGGKDATPKERERQAKQIAAGKAAGLGQVAMLALAKKGATLVIDKDTKKPTVVPPSTGGDNRGGHNAKTPLEQITEMLGKVVDIAKGGEIDREQVLTILATHLVTAELMTADETLEVIE